MFGHARCSFCRKTGHKADMIKIDLGYFVEYRHEECHMKLEGVRRCECGAGFVRDYGFLKNEILGPIANEKTKTNECCKKYVNQCSPCAIFSLYFCSGSEWNAGTLFHKDNPIIVKYCPECGAELPTQ